MTGLVVKVARPKRIVIWGTGFVGKMVIAEVLKHPEFDLCGCWSE